METVGSDGEKMSSKCGYEERVIAFLDILGFKKIIEETETETKKFEDLLDVLKRIKEGVEQLKTGKYNPTDIRMSTFSDSIIISAKITEHMDAFVQQLLMTNIWLLEQGCFVRGGVDYGKVYHNENMIFGPAFIKAYELEKSADYPRILFSKEAIKKLHHNKQPNSKIAVSITHSYFKRDCDGLCYLDYFNYANNAEEGYAKFICNLEKMMDKNIASNLDDVGVIKKMDWIKNKIQLCNKNQEQKQNLTLDDFIENFMDCVEYT